MADQRDLVRDDPEGKPRYMGLGVTTSGSGECMLGTRHRAYGLGRGVAASVCVLLTCVGSPAIAEEPSTRASDRDCSDFSSQSDAQRYFRSHGGPGSDPDRLNADGDRRACESLPCPCNKPKPRRADFPARVIRVIDGDTIVVRSSSNRRIYTVQLLGTDTPEVFGRRECGGHNATISVKRLVALERRVRVYGDEAQDRRDRRGRLLAYVKTRSGPQLNIVQVARGWAKLFGGGKPFQWGREFRFVAAVAKETERGVWGQCGGHFHKPV